MTDDIQFTKSELLGRIDESWTELMGLVGDLDEATLARTDAESGWSIADHLRHLAAWERGIAYLLGRRPRHDGMGITADQWLMLTMDEINDEMHQRGRERPPAAALGELRDAHAELLTAFEGLEMEDLLRDYSAYDTSSEFQDRPVVSWVVGNTFAHFDEHANYIRRALDK